MEYWKAYQKTQKYKKYRRTYSQKYRFLKRLELIDGLGGACVWCGIKDMRVLQLDKITGGHGKLRQTYSSTMQLYYSLLKNMEQTRKEWQILCANCNWIKRWRNNENPYQQPLNKENTIRY